MTQKMERISVDVGEEIRATVTFTDPDDSSAVDPTAVFFAIKSPVHKRTVYQYGPDSEVTKIEAGKYRLTFSVDKAGTWYGRAYATGTGKAAELFEIEVAKDHTIV